MLLETFMPPVLALDFSESLAPIDATLGPAGPGGASGSHQISSGQGSAEAKAAALAGPPHITEFCQKLAALEFHEFAPGNQGRTVYSKKIVGGGNF